MKRLLASISTRLFPSVPRALARTATAAAALTSTRGPVGGDGPRVEQAPAAANPTPAAAGPPDCEVLVYFAPHPSHAQEFTDHWLAHLVDRWGKA